MNCENLDVCEPRKLRPRPVAAESPVPPPSAEAVAFTPGSFAAGALLQSPELPPGRPQLLPVTPHDVLRVEILKLAERQDSLTRVVEEHTTSLRSLLKEQQADLRDMIDIRFKELPGKMSPFHTVDSTLSPNPPGVASGLLGQASRENSRRQRTSSTGVGRYPSEKQMASKKAAEELPEQPEPGVPAVDAKPNTSLAVLVERLRVFVNAPLFEVIMGAVIVINIGSIFIQLQLKGYDSAYKLGLSKDDGGYPDAEKFFGTLELVFNGIYLIELVLRLWVKRLQYFRDPMGCIDAVVVAVCCLQSFILEPAGLTLEETLVQIVRLFRLFRIFKIFRFMNTVESLRILLRTLSMSAGNLLWSMVLIGVIIIAAGVLMAQVLNGYIEDEEADFNTRKWVYMQYGSAARATYTMFEGAFTAAWTRNAELLIEDVWYGYAAFYVFYVILINFAMIRVISALFLKQTMQVASSDAEKRAVDKMQERTKFLEDVRHFFEVMDESGDGVLDEKEFNHMLSQAKVQNLFDMLEVSHAEARMLFEVLSGEEGVVDYREFLDGAMKMKHSSRAVESVQVLHEVTVLQRRIDNLSLGVKLIFDVACPGQSHLWDHKAAPRRRKMNTRYQDSPRSTDEVAWLM